MRAICVAMLLMLASASAAAEDEVGRAARDLSGELMSPFCPGRTLADCPSPDAAHLRRQIEARLEAGESTEAIVAAFTEQYGEALLAAPPRSGWGMVAWVVPGLAVCTAGALLVLWLRRHRAAPAGPPSPAAPADPRLAAELDRLLRDG